jgi:hydroxymethylglutaryl-CoA lyase
MEHVKIIECPRDAWQGLPSVIPTEAKVAYLRKLIGAGFAHIDAVSFVSPKLVPQMADSEAVMAALSARIEAGSSRRDAVSNTKSRLRREGDTFPEIIGIVVNEKGLERALGTPGVTTIGYPHSISSTFLRQNAKLSVEQSRALVKKIKQTIESASHSKPDFVVYLSMAFGNPYGEAWTPELVAEEVRWLVEARISPISLADTVGKARAEDVTQVFSLVRKSTSASPPRRASGKNLEIGVHLHSRAEGAAEKVLAAFEAGCRRFDSALTGLGGCPFAGDELVGNIPTETVVSALTARGVTVDIEPWALLAAVEATKEIRKQFTQ